MKAELVPEDGSPPIPIIRDVSVVGRREYCDVRVDHPSLSKRHAVLVKTDGLLILRDLVSTNGTKVKGQRIRWAALLPDDRISFGSIKFRVYLGPDNVPGPSERPRAVASNGRPAPSIPREPMVASSRLVKDNDQTGSEDWRQAMAPRPGAKAPVAYNDHELVIEDDDIVDLDDDGIIDLH